MLNILYALIRTDDSRKRSAFLINFFFNKLCKLMKYWILLAIIYKRILKITSFLKLLNKNLKETLPSILYLTY